MGGGTDEEEDDDEVGVLKDPQLACQSGRWTDEDEDDADTWPACVWLMARVRCLGFELARGPRWR